MKNKYIRFLVLLGALSVMGIVVVQVFWLQKAFDLREKQFNYNVTLALDNTVQALCEYNQTDIPSQNPIEQVSGNYYIVRTNNVIPPQTLESLLRSEFRKRIIKTDFEYTIYDCSNQRVVYKDYVNINSDGQSATRKETPEFSENEYYFGVFFPNKTASIVNQMGVWIFSSSVLFVVVIFFAFALMVIFRQKRMSEIHRDFVNNMAHEFNTPISSIGLAAGYFRQQKAMEQISKSDRYLSIIENENQKLKKQVDEILQLGRYEQEEYVPDIRNCSIDEVIREAYEDVMTRYPDSGLSLKMPTNHSPMACADPGHLRNVFLNLFENTIKYCSEEPVVDITFHDRKKLLSIDFSDNGNGIEKKYHKKIFNRFFRVPGGDTRQTKGFGIGLFYIRFILKKMGGRITLLQSDANGTIFNIQLRKQNG